MTEHNGMNIDLLGVETGTLESSDLEESAYEDIQNAEIQFESIKQTNIQSQSNFSEGSSLAAGLHPLSWSKSKISFELTNMNPPSVVDQSGSRSRTERYYIGDSNGLRLTSREVEKEFKAMERQRYEDIKIQYQASQMPTVKKQLRLGEEPELVIGKECYHPNLEYVIAEVALSPYNVPPGVRYVREKSELHRAIRQARYHPTITALEVEAEDVQLTFNEEENPKKRSASSRVRQARGRAKAKKSHWVGARGPSQKEEGWKLTVSAAPDDRIDVFVETDNSAGFSTDQIRYNLTLPRALRGDSLRYSPSSRPAESNDAYMTSFPAIAAHKSTYGPSYERTIASAPESPSKEVSCFEDFASVGRESARPWSASAAPARGENLVGRPIPSTAAGTSTQHGWTEQTDRLSPVTAETRRRKAEAHLGNINEELLRGFVDDARVLSAEDREDYDVGQSSRSPSPSPHYKRRSKAPKQAILPSTPPAHVSRERSPVASPAKTRRSPSRRSPGSGRGGAAKYVSEEAQKLQMLDHLERLHIRQLRHRKPPSCHSDAVPVHKLPPKLVEKLRLKFEEVVKYRWEYANPQLFEVVHAENSTSAAVAAATAIARSRSHSRKTLQTMKTQSTLASLQTHQSTTADDPAIPVIAEHHTAITQTKGAQEAEGDYSDAVQKVSFVSVASVKKPKHPDGKSKLKKSKRSRPRKKTEQDVAPSKAIPVAFSQREVAPSRESRIEDGLEEDPVRKPSMASDADSTDSSRLSVMSTAASHHGLLRFLDLLEFNSQDELESTSDSLMNISRPPSFFSFDSNNESLDLPDTSGLEFPGVEFAEEPLSRGKLAGLLRDVLASPGNDTLEIGRRISRPHSASYGGLAPNSKPPAIRGNVYGTDVTGRSRRSNPSRRVSPLHASPRVSRAYQKARDERIVFDTFPP